MPASQVFAICYTVSQQGIHVKKKTLASFLLNLPSPRPGAVFPGIPTDTEVSWMNPMNQRLMYGKQHFAVACSWLQCTMQKLINMHRWSQAYALLGTQTELVSHQHQQRECHFPVSSAAPSTNSTHQSFLHQRAACVPTTLEALSYDFPIPAEERKIEAMS